MIDLCRVFHDVDGRPTVHIAGPDFDALFRPDEPIGVTIDKGAHWRWDEVASHTLATAHARACEVAFTLHEARRRAQPVSRHIELPPLAPNERAERWIAKRDPSSAGRCGRGTRCPSHRARVFGVAVVLRRGFALSAADALSQLLSWNATNDPPLSERDLRSMVNDAEHSRMPLGKYLHAANAAQIKVA